MRIKKVNHLGIVPKNVLKAKEFFKLFQLTPEGSEIVAEQKVKVDFLQTSNVRLELLEATDESSPIAQFLNTRGSGIQHIALEVDNVMECIQTLKQKGVQLIDEQPRVGAHSTKIAFVHPRSTGGILVELVEEKSK